MSGITTAIEAQRPSYFFWCPVLLGCGIGIYFALKSEPNLTVITTALCLSFALLWLIPRRQTALLAGLCAFGIIGAGFGLATWRAHLVSAPTLDYRYYGAVTGQIAGISRSHGNALRITLDRVVIPSLPRDETPARVRISLLNGAPHADIEPGNWVTITANLSPPSAPAEPGGFDFRRHAWFQKLGAIGYAHASPLPAQSFHENRTLGLWIFKLRKTISDAVRREIDGPTGAFAAAIVTGDRSEIDPENMGDLRASNLAHLLAISGLHMGLLTGFVLLIVRSSLTILPGVGLRWPVKKIAAASALAAGAAYLALSGASVATQRAFIMAAVIYGAILFDRQALTLRSVALAALIVLIWRPESLASAGFQMSFAATTGLVVAFQYLRATRLWNQLKSGPQRFLRPVFMLVFSSAVAGLATAPFSAFHFNQVAQYGLLANFLAVPMMGMIVMPAAVLAAILSIIGLHFLPLMAMGLGIDWILGVAHFVTELDGSVRRIPSGDDWVLPLLSFGALFAILWKGRLAPLGVGLVAVSFWGWSSAERPLALVSQDGRLIGVQTAKGRSLSHEKGNGFAARSWLENDGDPMSQEQASLRSGFSVHQGITQITLGSTELLQIRSKKIDPSPFCTKNTVMIATEIWDKPAGECVFFGKSELRDNGALAIIQTRNELKIIGAKPASGRRLWTQ